MASNANLFEGLIIDDKQPAGEPLEAAQPVQQQQPITQQPEAAQQPVAQQQQPKTQNTELFEGLIVDDQPVTPVVQQQAPTLDQQQSPLTGGFLGADITQTVRRTQQDLPQAPSPFPEAREETRAVQELPELGAGGLLAGENAARVAAISPVLLATTNPQELASVISSNFPNIGISSDPGGNLLATNNETGAQVVLNKPGLSQLDIVQGLGVITSFLPAAQAAAIPASVTGRVIAGATASGLTQATIEGIQEQVGGTLDKEEIALAAALGGVAETVVPAIRSFRESRRARTLDVERGQVAEAVQQIRPAREAQAALQEATGVEVPLFQAQQTLSPSTLIKQRLVPQLEAGAQKASRSLEQQNQQAFDATSELINTIAPAEIVATGAKRFRSAAQKALDARKQARSEAVKPLYKEALKKGAKVDLKPVNKIIKEALKDAPKSGKFAKNLNRVKRLIKGEKLPSGAIVAETGEPLIRPSVKSPSLRTLHKAKLELGDMIDKFGEGSLSNTAKREVLQIKKALDEQLATASPLYKQANDKFRDLSPAVGELEESILGNIAKISEAQLKNVSRRIFDVAESNPQVVKNAKSVIDEVDPGAWNDLMRVEFQRRFAGVETLSEDLPGELVGNVPGQLRRAVFGNPEQRRTLLAGMSAEQRKNFVYLDDVLRRASAGRHAGSPTVPFGEVAGKLRGTIGAIRDAILKPLDAIRATGERGLFDRNVSKLTDVLFNPKWEPTLRELRSVQPTSETAEKLMKGLLDSAKSSLQITDIE